MTNILTCCNLTFAYNNVVVSEGVDFSLDYGDYLCIVGENGSGKSTLLRGLLGIITPTHGSITWDKKLQRNEIGYLPQQNALQNDFPASVYEIVLSGRQNAHLLPFYTKNDRLSAYANMELLHIEHLANAPYSGLSGGQKQRVLLARALCASHSVLLLDEPVTGFDPLIEQEFYQLIEHLNKKHHLTIIMVTHDIRKSLKYASHILHLAHKQVFFGPKEDYAQSAIGKLFLQEERVTT